jgi:hypothetical protein
MNGPVDRDEWGQGPQTVNAYYSAEMNEIAFPAAILQPPAFDANTDPAINYGGIGAVIGHEMGHGYDDHGAKSDEKGVLRNWWLPEDEQRFKALTAKLAAQYSSYSPIEGQRVSGDATPGENIGDLGGLSVAFEGVQPLARRQAGAGHRRLDGSAAVLPRVGPGVARQVPRRVPPADPRERRPLARDVPGQRGRPEHRRVVRGVRREAGGQAVPAARGARAHLVRRASRSRRLHGPAPGVPSGW